MANFDDDKIKIETLMNQLSPDQQHIAKTLASLKAENAFLRGQLNSIKPLYDELYKIFAVLLHASEKKEIRIHDTQFLRFAEEYRIDRFYNEKTREIILRLLTLKDELPRG